MLEKIIDRYYIKKYKRLINNIMIEYNLDYKIRISNEYISLLVKYRMYNDEQYATIFVINKKNAFITLCRYEELEQTIKDRIKMYCEREKERI